jgi:hypothetical protein
MSGPQPCQHDFRPSSPQGQWLVHISGLETKDGTTFLCGLSWKAKPIGSDYLSAAMTGCFCYQWFQIIRYDNIRA